MGIGWYCTWAGIPPPLVDRTTTYVIKGDGDRVVLYVGGYPLPPPPPRGPHHNVYYKGGGDRVVLYVGGYPLPPPPPPPVDRTTTYVIKGMGIGR